MRFFLSVGARPAPSAGLATIRPVRPIVAAFALVVAGYGVAGYLDAAGETAAAGPVLPSSSAARVVRARAALQHRPDFRVESTARRSATRVRVCWSEPGYLSPDDGRDVGCDLVELRGCGQYWVRDASSVVPVWRRFLP